MLDSKIFEIIKNTFPNSTKNINTNTTANDVDEWDSLGHIMLIQAIETEFNIQFNLDELLEFNSVGDIINAVASKKR